MSAFFHVTIRPLSFLMLMCIILTGGPASLAQSLAPTDVFFPVKSFGQARISPSGQFVSVVDYRNPGQAQILISDLNSESAPKPLAMPNANIVWTKWVNDKRLIIAQNTFLRQELIDLDEDESTLDRFVKSKSKTHLVLIDRDGSNKVDLFSEAEFRSQNWTPNNIFVKSTPSQTISVQTRLEGRVSVVEVNVKTGAYETLKTGDKTTRGFYLDRDGKISVTLKQHKKKGDMTLHANKGAFFKIPYKNRFHIDFAGISANGDTAYISKTENPDTPNVIYAINVTSKKHQQKISTDSRAGFQLAAQDSDGYFIGAGYAEALIKYAFLDKTHQKRMNGIQSYFGDQTNLYLAGNSRDHSRWLIFASGPEDPGAYYIYDASTKAINHLVDMYSGTQKSAYSRVTALRYPSRDGLDIPALITHPLNKSDTEKAPLIILPHGGPHARDYFAFNGFAQFLASRGYRVFQPNFRGSTGFSYNFEAAGHQQWGRAMQDDITDGLEHMVKTGLTDANSICIMGMSYGGYAALWATIDTPEKYQCAISINGVTDIEDQAQFFIDKYDHYLGFEDAIHNRIGNPDTDSKTLRAYSPVYNTDKIKTPILMIHGKSDSTVPVRQARAFKDAAKVHNVELKYIEKERSGHSLTQDLGEFNSDGSHVDYRRPVKTTLADVDVFLKAHLDQD